MAQPHWACLLFCVMMVLPHRAQAVRHTVITKLPLMYCKGRLEPGSSPLGSNYSGPHHEGDQRQASGNPWKAQWVQASPSRTLSFVHEAGPLGLLAA